MCPFGWFQELLHKLPGKKLSTKKLKPLTYLKYLVLLLMVVLLPAFAVDELGMGDPFFCKYLCPQWLSSYRFISAFASASSAACSISAA